MVNCIYICVQSVDPKTKITTKRDKYITGTDIQFLVAILRANEDDRVADEILSLVTGH